MSNNLVNHLQRLLAEADIVMQQLTDTTVTNDNYQDLAYNLDSTSGCVVIGLFEVREHIVDAIEQFSDFLVDNA